MGEQNEAAPKTGRERGPHPWMTWVILLAVALIAVLPVALGVGSDMAEPFTGADGQGEEAIMANDPGYEAWFSPVLELPSGEIESGVFALQAAIGAGIIGYYFGVVRTRHRLAREHSADAPQGAPTGQEPSIERP
ncbi:energy-coupling factor ABC transporter substrate-binding protein [Salinactinospora qingdaonensis]|uniref:Cobalt transport protein CbiN n=1 Tax=Salinactinospora qingdaonensis TaxID=702744 RepID=A0ABP7EVF6_9ACTN